jgi:hypothetical protein
MAKRKRQTRQWPKEKDGQDNGQKIKDNMTNNDLPTITQKNKDRAIRTPLITGDELKYSGRVSSSFSTSGTRRVTLVTKPVIIYKGGKDRIMIMTTGPYPWSFVKQIFRNG